MQISTQVDWFDAIRNQDYNAIYDADGSFHGSQDAAGETGLMKAAKFNDIRLAKMLAPVEAGIINYEGHNALMIAALNNNAQICSFLVEIPSERDHRLAYGEDALILAASVGALRTVATLLPHLERNRDNKNRTCLSYAACNGKLGVVNYLIRYKKEISDMEAKAALVAAAGNNHEDCVHALSIFIRDGKINYLANVPTDIDELEANQYRFDDVLPQTDLGIQGLHNSNIYNPRPAEAHINQYSMEPEYNNNYMQQSQLMASQRVASPSTASQYVPAQGTASFCANEEKLEFVPEAGVVEKFDMLKYVEPNLDESPRASMLRRGNPSKKSPASPREKRAKTPTSKTTRTPRPQKSKSPAASLRVSNTQITPVSGARASSPERTFTSSTLLSNTYNTSNLNRNFTRSIVHDEASPPPRASTYVTPGQGTLAGGASTRRMSTGAGARLTRSSYVDTAQSSLYEAIEKASKKKFVTPQMTHPRSLDADLLNASPSMQEALVARYYEGITPPPKQPGSNPSSAKAKLNKSNVKAIRCNGNNRVAELNPLSGTFYGPSITVDTSNFTNSLATSIIHPATTRDLKASDGTRTFSRSQSRTQLVRDRTLSGSRIDMNESISPNRSPQMSVRSSSIRLKEEVDYRPTYINTRTDIPTDRYEDSLSLNPLQTAMPIGPLSRHIQKEDITILEIPCFELDDTYTDLMRAIHHGDKKQVKQTIKTQANHPSVTHLTALMIAARVGDVATAKLLIKAGEVKHRSSEGWTALMIATFHNSVELVKLLVEHEAGEVTNDGWTALMIGVKFNVLSCVEVLANYEGGIQDKQNISAMMIAAYMGRAGIIPLLIGREARLCDHLGRTAMMHATLNNEVECVEKLVYAENNMQDPEGRTALMMAAQLGYNDIVLVLQKDESGKRANMGRTALMFAARNCNTLGVQVLAGTECGLQDAEGWSAMMMAVLDNQAEIVKLLKEYEANLKTNKGFTALMFASRFGFDECVEILAPVEAGEQTPTGWSALMAAVANNNLTAARMLVPYEVMLQDSKKNTALMLACKKNNSEMIRMLRQAQESIRNVRNTTRR